MNDRYARGCQDRYAEVVSDQVINVDQRMGLQNVFGCLKHVLLTRQAHRQKKVKLSIACSIVESKKSKKV